MQTRRDRGWVMQCPHCGNDTTGSVVDSRHIDSPSGVRRRRICGSCKRRFTTYEHTKHEVLRVQRENDDLRVILKNLSRGFKALEEYS